MNQAADRMPRCDMCSEVGTTFGCGCREKVHQICVECLVLQTIDPAKGETRHCLFAPRSALICKLKGACGMSASNGMCGELYCVRMICEKCFPVETVIQHGGMCIFCHTVKAAEKKRDESSRGAKRPCT